MLASPPTPNGPLLQAPPRILAAAVIVAAGRGTRAGGEIAKQWQPLAGKRVLDWTIEAFRTSPFIGRIVVVVHPDEIDMIGGADILVVPGGNSRAASVRAGLEALAGSAPEAVLIHDGARACVPDRVIEDMTRMVEKYEAVAPGLAVNDALWSDGGSQSSLSGANASGLSLCRNS